MWRGRPRPRITRIQASTLWLKWPAAPLFRLLEAVLSERNTLLDANSLRRIRQLLAPDGAWKPSHRPAADILSAAPECLFRTQRTNRGSSPLTLRAPARAS